MTARTDAGDLIPMPLDERDVRALTEHLLVDEIAPDLYHVYSETGRQYAVGLRDEVCTCPDFEYRDVRCKHIRRAQLEAGSFDANGLRESLERSLTRLDERIGALVEARRELADVVDGLQDFGGDRDA